MKDTSLKSISFSLNTAQSGEVKYITKKITGILRAVYLKSSNTIQIKITIDNFEKVEVFNKVDFSDSAYLPLQTESISNKFEKFNFTTQPYYLNHSLVFDVKGGKSTNIDIEVLYE